MFNPIVFIAEINTKAEAKCTCGVIEGGGFGKCACGSMAGAGRPPKN
jgi:hypothetical protein